MTTDDQESSDLNRTLAGMLGELEDEHTRLVQRQGELMGELDSVTTEIERVEAIRLAITGKPVRRKAPTSRRTSAVPGAGTRREQEASAAAERVEKVKEYGRRNGGTFTGRQAAESLGMKFQGVGPILAGMVRRGEATVEEHDGTRVYTLVDA